MTKLNIYNKLFIAFFALLVVIIIWKVPHEKNGPPPKQTTINTGGK